METSNLNNEPSPIHRSKLDLYKTQIKNIPFFKQLSQSQFNELMELMSEVSHQAGDIIVEKGDIINAVYVIIQGQAEVNKEQITNQQKELIPICMLQENDTIGLSDSGFFSHTNLRTATVIAKTTVLLLKLNIKDLHKFLQKNPLISQTMEKSAEQMQRLSLIKEAAPFMHLSSEELLFLNESIEKKFYVEGIAIFHQGDKSDKCYLIANGKIGIFINIAGEESQIAELKTGDVFGEQALLMDTVRNATARTLTGCSLYSLKRDAVVELWQQESKMKKDMLAVMIERQRLTHKEIVQSSETKLIDGEVIYTIKNADGNYFRLTSEGWFIWKLLDGTHSLKDINQAYLTQYQHEATVMINNLLIDLIMAGFIVEETTEVFMVDKKPTGLEKLIYKIQRFFGWKQ